MKEITGIAKQIQEQAEALATGQGGKAMAPVILSQIQALASQAQSIADTPDDAEPADGDTPKDPPPQPPNP